VWIAQGMVGSAAGNEVTTDRWALDKVAVVERVEI
jgi:hypothetical protein